MERINASRFRELEKTAFASMTESDPADGSLTTYLVNAYEEVIAEKVILRGKVHYFELSFED